MERPDELLEQHRLAHARAADQAGLAPPRQRRQQVDDLDPRLEELDAATLGDQRRGGAVDRPRLAPGQRGPAIQRLAEHVEQPPERRRSHRDHDRPSRPPDRHPAGQALRRRHRDGPHRPEIDVMSHLEHDRPLAVREGQGLIDRRQAIREARLDDRTADGRDAPFPSSRIRRAIRCSQHDAGISQRGRAANKKAHETVNRRPRGLAGPVAGRPALSPTMRSHVLDLRRNRTPLQPSRARISAAAQRLASARPGAVCLASVPLQHVASGEFGPRRRWTVGSRWLSRPAPGPAKGIRR